MTDRKYPSAERRKRTNLTVREDVMAEAKALGLNTSRAAEAGIEAAIREEKGRRWLEENREGIRAYNERYEREGPLLPPPWWAQPADD
ncbi:type II toxin-antitoxin system CcdA family antitoxin [Maricaulis maris]|uniref:type II toxin-antitoxin system CcdA family antitoxin n=1 Tax=Maricaulis maris TaxID=74318 RepID=UPI0026EBA8CF|nr:type II toxin-antitoxin system CcdA family antitoxin [Maricaulis maris]